MTKIVRCGSTDCIFHIWRRQRAVLIAPPLPHSSPPDLEDTLASVRRARAINAVKKMQAGAVAEGISGMTMEEIDQEIRAYRNRKKT